MKKLILLIAVATLSIITYGQAKIAIGVKGGLNFSKADVSNFSTSGKTGYHGGAYALFKFSKIGIQPEIIFSQQGSVVDIDDWNTKYLNIPIIVKLYIAAGVNLQTGPQFGFLSKAELQNGNKIADKLKSSDLSLAMGAGWDAPFGMNFTARYNLGLSNNSSGSKIESIKNQVFQVSVGIRLFKFGI